MKHSKEWHSCDRCGKEIEKTRGFTKTFSKAFLSPATIEMLFGVGTKCYQNPLIIQKDDLGSVELIERHDVNQRNYDLCPKCRKDFERFMKNGKN